jgi:dihydrodiol dehydrogenase / D-xylose 1-dehydrogenase (NADP)
MLRWGILGTSFISHTVVKAIQKSHGSCITAVFGRDEARLKAFAEKYNITKIFTSIHNILDDTDVDVFYIGLPSHLHATTVIAAAMRGKPVLSEKSLATTMGDSHAMIEAVREANTFFLEGLMYLSHPLMTKVAELVRSGELGSICSISGHYAANIGQKANPLGKGTIYNLGCYPVSLVHFISETAFGSESFSGRQVLGTGNVVKDGVHRVQDAALCVRFSNGVLATIQSTDSFGNDFAFVINGSKASMRFKTNPWLPLAGDNIIEIRQYGGKTRDIFVTSELDAFDCQVRLVENCISAGLKQAPRPSPGWTHSVEIMSLLTEWEDQIMNSV